MKRTATVRQLFSHLRSIGVQAVLAWMLSRLLAGVTSTGASASTSRRIAAHLTSASFTAAQASGVKVVYRFSSRSSRFGYVLSRRRGSRWVTVRSVSERGRFTGSHAMTVKQLFGTKPITVAQYQVKLSASANSVTLRFRVVNAPAPVAAPSPTAPSPVAPSPTGPLPISGSAELASLIPSYLSKDLSVTCGSTALIVAPHTGPTTGPIQVDSSASAEEPCSNSASQKPETVVLFVAFPNSTSEQAYYDELLSLNGMTQNSGGCGSQTLVLSVPEQNQYCEDAYPARGSNSNGGRVFLYSAGPGVWLDANEDSLTASEPCTFANPKQVLGFTDPQYTAVTIAENCSTNSNEMSAMYSDFSNGKLNLGT